MTKLLELRVSKHILSHTIYFPAGSDITVLVSTTMFISILLGLMGCRILHSTGRKRRGCVLATHLFGKVTPSSGMMEISFALFLPLQLSLWALILWNKWGLFGYGTKWIAAGDLEGVISAAVVMWMLMSCTDDLCLCLLTKWVLLILQCNHQG